MSIVRIVALENGEPIGAGSGVITAANGVIYTNHHVVECSNDYLIEVIENSDQINRPPVPRYLATLVGAYPGLDFAILQINRRYDPTTQKTTSVLPGEIALPFIPAAEGTEVKQLDEVTIYGYPAIADGVLQISQGQVTGIRDRDFEDVGTVTVEYQTDALMSFGSSGGGAFIDGRYIGIPSGGRSDSNNTAGIIVPISTVLKIAREVPPTPLPFPCQDDAPPSTSSPTPVAENPLPDALVAMTYGLGGDWETRQVHIFDTRTGQRTQLTDCKLSWAPSISPDGSKIVYLSTCDNEDTEVWVMNIDGSSKTQLTRTAQWEDTPSWSPDGRQIVYSRWDASNDIWIMNSDGSNARPLDTANTGDFEIYPTWSPDGRWISFFSSPQAENSTYRICFAAADGSGSRNCPIDPGAHNTIWDVGPIAWTADSQAVIYRAIVDGADHLIISALDGTNPRNLTSNVPGWHAFPFLSPDGATLFFNGGVAEEDFVGRIYRMRVDGSDIDHFTFAPDSGWQLSFFVLP